MDKLYLHCHVQTANLGAKIHNLFHAPKKSSLQSIADELHGIECEFAAQNGIAPPQRRISLSTISRNRTKTGRYNPRCAHEMAMERRERIVRNTALKPGVLATAIALLKDRTWSPEQISGHLRKKGIYISKERI